MNWSLHYYQSGWQNITDDVLEITNIAYAIDNRVQGQATVLNVILDENSTYGTGKYKLTLGSHYFLYAVPLDGIERLKNKKVNLTLVDYFFYKLDKKIPLKITGEGDTGAFGGGEISVKSIKDFTVAYRTSQHAINLEEFSSRDDEHFSDGQGSVVKVDSALRYESRGKIYSKSQSTEIGQIFVKIEDILGDIATGENMTLDVDYGYGDEDINSLANISLTNVKRVWDAKFMNGHIIFLDSIVGYLYLSVYDTGGNYKSSVNWESRDWDSTSDGIDNIGFKIYCDYHNEYIYVLRWNCDDYIHDDPTNPYLLHITKFSISDAGILTQVYSFPLSAANYVEWLIDPIVDRPGFDERLARWHFLGFRYHWIYADEDVTRIILVCASSRKVIVIDPDRGNAGLSDWRYEYISDYSIYHLMPDEENGSVVLMSHDGSNYVREIFRVDMPSLTAGYPIHMRGGTIVSEDDPASNPNKNAVATWRESIYYWDHSGTTIYQMPPQLPNGIFIGNYVWNKYIRDHKNYCGFSSFGVVNSGNAWDPVNDIAFAWRSDTDLNPGLLYWQRASNFVYRRIYLFQPYAYIDRKQQFIDAFVTFGFFYEQKDDKVRLFRIRGTGSSLGTISDILFCKKLQGFSRFADEYTIKVLGRDVPFGSGDRKQEIKTIMGKYGWNSTTQTKYYTDWVDKINGSENGIEVTVDLEAFNTAVSTYTPDLGKTFIYDLITYILIGVSIDIEDWTIKLIGVQN